MIGATLCGSLSPRTPQILQWSGGATQQWTGRAAQLWRSTPFGSYGRRSPPSPTQLPASLPLRPSPSSSPPVLFSSRPPLPLAGTQKLLLSPLSLSRPPEAILHTFPSRDFFPEGTRTHRPFNTRQPSTTASIVMMTHIYPTVPSAPAIRRPTAIRLRASAAPSPRRPLGGKTHLSLRFAPTTFCANPSPHRRRRHIALCARQGWPSPPSS